MAVIITDMEVPPTCNHCKLCIKGKVTDYGQFGDCILTNKKVNLMTWNIDADCPLKSADEMIKEIEEYNNPLIGKNVVLDIIHKYTDKADNEVEE